MGWKTAVCAIFILLLAFTIHTFIGFDLKFNMCSHMKFDNGYESAEKFEYMDLNLSLFKSVPWTWLWRTFAMVIAVVLIVALILEALKSLMLYLICHMLDILADHLVEVSLSNDMNLLPPLEDMRG